MNKIAENYERAMYRARATSPRRSTPSACTAARPCALSEEMRCYDCASPDRICNGVVTLLRPMGRIKETEVVLVGEVWGIEKNRI